MAPTQMASDTPESDSSEAALALALRERKRAEVRPKRKHFFIRARSCSGFGHQRFDGTCVRVVRVKRPGKGLILPAHLGSLGRRCFHAPGNGLVVFRRPWTGALNGHGRHAFLDFGGESF